MLITTEFAFLHVPKTGGSFVRRVLQESVPAQAVTATGEQHASWRSIPEHASGLPVLCFVRNPWDWYVSWYAYHMQVPRERRRGSALFRTAFGGGTHDFATTVRLACDGPIEHEDPLVPEVMRTLSTDFYTARFLTIAGGLLADERLTVGRVETLADDLTAFLCDVGGTSAPGLDPDALGRQPPMRASRRGPYRDYYDDDLRELVRLRAGLIVELYGYAF